jgi:hypothetical protein
MGLVRYTKGAGSLIRCVGYTYLDDGIQFLFSSAVTSCHHFKIFFGCEIMWCSHDSETSEVRNIKF